jgi:hypothetical protein
MVGPDKELDLELKSFNQSKITPTKLEPQREVKQTVVKKEEKKKVDNTVVVKKDITPKTENETKNLSFEDKWEISQKKRQYHYDGVKPIMMSADIKEPLNLILLYFLTIFLVWYFLAKKLIQATVIKLVEVIENRNTSKPIRIFAWTILITIVLLTVLAIIILITK